jgi:DNA-binding transcriptional MocR family regulator
MTPGGTFERVYGAIRQRLRQGCYRPGERLEPAALSDELNASVTPVRDALHRLTGERLVEAPRHDGFRAPMLTETLLRHYYSWRLELLLLALRSGRGVLNLPDVGAAAHEIAVADRVNALFLSIARTPMNPEHLLALQAITEKLEPVQRIEPLVFDELESEAAGLRDAARAGDTKALRRGLTRYHKRRERSVATLLARLQQD